MSLQPGNRLGSYRVIAKIGAGGMVYRATDTKLFSPPQAAGVGTSLRAIAAQCRMIPATP